ncbi:MFS transporter [Salmonella enterica subsp. enterica serovar Choleraesuis]|nr:MFS transporter [Salmonella enterica subsp. enterica serovar Choleraesuis]
MNATPSQSQTVPLFTMALGAGISVAAIYYAQPMLPLLGDSLNLTVPQQSLIPAITQAGYALGIFFLLPLGDRYNRRYLIAAKSAMLALLLLACSFCLHLPGLLVISLLIGMMATLAQDIVPAAAILAPNGRQGKTVGTVMTGLLLGILLSRTLSGVVSAHFGWQAMFQLAAVSVTLTGIILWRQLPDFTPHSQQSYPALLGSMWSLWRKYAPLRHAALAQALLSVGFSAFWSTLAVYLAQRFQLGSASAGLFGLAGAAGAMAAPLAGKLSDRLGSERIAELSALLVGASFALMLLLPILPTWAQLALIAVSAVGFDLGLQSALVSHQNQVYSLEPEARGRLNAVMFSLVFIGMSVGSVAGGYVFRGLGWNGIVTMSVLAALLSLAVRLHGRTPVSQPAA